VSDFLTGPPPPPSRPDHGPDFQWDDRGPVSESPRPPADDHLNGEEGENLPPITTGRVFSRSFFMLLGAVALVGLTVIGAFGLNRDDKKTITGSVVLFDAAGDGIAGSQTNCYGDGGYDDIDSGTQVMVKNGDGKILATTTLQSGSGETAGDVLGDGGVTTTTAYDSYGSSFLSTVVRCTFPFEVEVPSGEKFYSVTVGSNEHRGTLTYSKDDMDKKDWKVDVSLG
jgi:hypothetical protein